MNRLIAAAFIAVLAAPALGQDKVEPNLFDDLIPKTPSTIGKTKPPTTIGELQRQITEPRAKEVAKCVLRYIDRAHTDLAVKFILASCQDWPRELRPLLERDIPLHGHDKELGADEFKELERLRKEQGAGQ